MRVNETLFFVLIGMLGVTSVKGSTGLWSLALLLSVVLISLQTILLLASVAKRTAQSSA